MYRSALYYAAYRGWAEVLELLQEMGALLNAMNGVLVVARGDAREWLRAIGDAVRIKGMRDALGVI